MSHKILEVVPFDIIGEVADVDAAVLLRRLPNVAHGLFPMGRAVLVWSILRSAVGRTWSSCSRTLSCHRRSTPARAMAAARSVPWGERPASVGTARTSTSVGRAGPLTLRVVSNWPRHQTLRLAPWLCRDKCGSAFNCMRGLQEKRWEAKAERSTVAVLGSPVRAGRRTLVMDHRLASSPRAAHYGPHRGIVRGNSR